MSSANCFRGFVADFISNRSKKAKAVNSSSRRRVPPGLPTRTIQIESLEARQLLSGFTSGDIALLQLAGTGNNTTGTVLELAPSGAAQTPALSVPISASTAATAMRFSDSGTSSFLSDTNDGSLLVLSGYNTTDAATSNLATVSALDPATDRAVGTLDSNENFTLQTTYTGTTGNQTRSATGIDDSNWAITDKGGLYTNGATSSSIGNINILNARAFGGTIYVSTTSQTVGVSAVATLSGPKASTLTALPGLPTGASADKSIQDFYLVQSGQNGSTYDLLYTLDQGSSTATINKFYLNGGAWMSEGSYAVKNAGGTGINATGMIAQESGGVVNLYVVTTAQAAGNAVVEYTDTAADNASINVNGASSVTLYTASPSSATLKGIAFAPQSATATTTAISSITPLSANQGQSVTFTATVAANSGSIAPTGGLVEFYNGALGGTFLATASTETTSGTTGTFSVSSTAVPAGTYSNIQAFYLSNPGFSNSNSATYPSTLSVTLAVGTSTSISSITPLTSNVGTPITFTATVSALAGGLAPGAGSISFYNGGISGTLLATATSENISGTTGTFAVTTSSVPAGNYSNVQAFYTPSAGFGSSSSSVFGSILKVQIPGLIAAWNFPTLAGAPDNSPAPSYGTGTATTLGMTNNYTNGAGTSGTAADDVLATPGTANPGFAENTWRIRGSGNNGWALAAPQYTQGIELDTSTVGYTNIVFSFDWYSTTQGIRDLQVQYNTGSGWTNYSGSSSSTGDFVASSNDYYNAQLSPVSQTIHIDLSNIAAANNNADLGIRLVSAYDSTGNLGNVYASAASTAASIIPYNNSSGNWRFGNLSFAAGITTATAITANPPGGQNPGQNVTFTATVTPASGAQYPSGTVAFYDGVNQLGTTQTVVQTGTSDVGTASITLSTLSAGVHGDITAQYTPVSGNGLIASGSSMNLFAGDPTDNPISYTINAPQATGVDVSPVIGQSFTGVVATFSDGTFTNPTGFSASIDWGDGNTSSGTIVFTGTTNDTNINGQTVAVSLFTVTGTHTYATAGTDTITVTITDPNNNAATVTPTARVAYAPLVVNPGSAINAVAGAPLTGVVVATFTDPGLVAALGTADLNNLESQFTASINWGDNSSADTGTISYDTGMGIFSVIGSHTYSQSDPYTVSVAVTPMTVSVERIDSSDPTNANLVGDEDGNTLTDAPSADFIDQYAIGPSNQAGSLYTFSLPTVSTTGGNEALTNSSYSVSEGEMTLSSNGEYLVTGGYNATVSAWTPQQTFSSASTINRVIGTISGAGVIDTTTALTDAYSGDNFRGVVSTDGTQFWTSGHSSFNPANDYVRYATYGPNASIGITGSSETPYNPENVNTVEIMNGQLYEGVRSVAAGAPAGIYQVGAGLPTTAGQTETLFIQVPQSNPLDIGAASKPMSPFDFYMADLPNNPNSINGVNVAYVADGEMGITRYDYNGANWQFSYYIDSTGTVKDADYTVDANGNITATASFDSTNAGNDDLDTTKAGGVKGITGRIVDGQVQLFAVTAFGVTGQPNPGEKLIEVNDPFAGNGGTASYTTLATDSGASELTSVAFTPTQTVTSSASVSTASTSLAALSAPSSTLVGNSLTVSTTLSRVDAPAGPVAGEAVQFTVTDPSGSQISSGTATTGAGGVVSYEFTPSLRGIYSISATYAGSSSLGASSSNTATVTAYQSTSLSLPSPVSSSAGNPVILSATLTATPGGAPISGETVQFTFGGGISPQSVVTDSSGVATVTVIFPSAGSFSANASFLDAANFYTDAAGDLPAVTESATTQVNVTRGITSLGTLSAPSTTLVGNAFTVSTTLTRVSAPSGAVPGASVTFTLFGPNSPTTAATVTVTTDANGLATASLTPPAGGAYTLSASFAGTGALAAASSNTASVTAYQPTLLSLPSSVSGTAGAPMSLSATLTTTPGGAPISGETVSFTFGGGIATQTATTNANGIATVTVIPPAAGSFSANASFLDAANFYTDAAGDLPAATENATTQVNVAPGITSLATLTAPSTVLVGNSLSVSTTLTRVSAPTGVVAGAQVTFTETNPLGAPTTMSGITDSNGNVSVSFPISLRGVYSVSASFAGNSALAASSSNATVTAYQRTSLSLPPATGAPGSSVTLSAVLTATPGGAPIAGETIHFNFGGVIPSQSATTNANGVATISVIFPNAGMFSATASFLDAANFYADATGAFPVVADTATTQVTIGQAGSTVTVSWTDGTSTTYNGNQHGATASWASTGTDGGGGPLTVSYVGINGTVYPLTTVAPTNAGQYAASATFVGDTNHTDSSNVADFTINKASSTTVTVGAGPFTYDGTTHAGGSGTVTGAGGLSTSATSLTYTGDRIDPGTYFVTAHYAGDANHLPSNGSPVAITINKGAPTLSNLAAPTIVVNTPLVTLGGQIAGKPGAAKPTGTVTIKISYGGVQLTSQTVSLTSSGSFSATFLSLFAKVGQYTLLYSYSGDANYAAYSSTVFGALTYGVQASGNPSAKAGSTVAINLELTDVFGLDFSSPSETVTATGIALASNPTAISPLPAGNTPTFTYSKGTYSLNLKTTGLAKGTYVLYFTAAGDPVTHSVQFVLV